MKKADLTIVSVGPGKTAWLSETVLNYLQSASPLILRTSQNPISFWLDEQAIPYISLDHLYDQSDDFDSLNHQIANQVRNYAVEGTEPVYAVPDVFSDRSVDSLFRLFNDSGLTIRVIPGFSYADYYLSRCRSLISSGNLRIVTAEELLASFYDPDENTLITEIDRETLAGDLKILLSDILDDEMSVYFFADDIDAPRKVPLFELDRQKHFDHLSALLIPATDYLHRSRHTVRDLLRIMERLRAPDGCPWDRIQTHSSLQPYIVEEAWESITAMDEEDPDHLADELGDLLFQIVFHASIGQSLDEFTFTDILTHICGKMIKRHPHVFGNEHFSSSKEVADQWETIKRSESGSQTVTESFDDVSAALPALKYSIKVMKKAQQTPAFRRNPEDLVREIAQNSENLLRPDGSLNETVMGTILILCTHLCHLCGTDAEIILHRSVDRFKEKMKSLEKMIEAKGISIENLTFAELCVYLKQVKE